MHSNFVQYTPQIETSCSKRTEDDRAEGAGEEERGKRCCCVATNWKGEEKEKRADLSRTVGFVPTFLTKELIL